jgi:ubiquinone/menaquinone biosynthesis C-methylase UbiE
MLVVAVAVAAVAAQGRDPKQYQQTLENPERIAGLQVDRVVKALGVKPGMRIADVGAGTGVFSLPFAKAVGPGGKVYAIDVDSGLLAIAKEKASGAGLANIDTIVAGPTDPKVPEPVDILFICDTMHHLPNQAEYVKQFAKLLKPGGRVAVIDFKEGNWPAGHESFKITPAQVDEWMQAAGLTRSAAHDFLATNFFHVYQLSASSYQLSAISYQAVSYQRRG